MAGFLVFGLASKANPQARIGEAGLAQSANPGLVSILNS